MTEQLKNKPTRPGMDQSRWLITKFGLRGPTIGQTISEAICSKPTGPPALETPPMQAASKGCEDD